MAATPTAPTVADVSTVIAQVMAQHRLTGTGTEPLRHRDYHTCACGTRHPVYSDGRWPTHEQHVAQKSAEQVAALYTNA